MRHPRVAVVILGTAAVGLGTDHVVQAQQPQVPMRAVDAVTQAYRRHMSIAPGTSLPLCIQGEWRIAGRKNVAAEGYDRKGDGPNNDADWVEHFPDIQDTLPARMALAYRLIDSIPATRERRLRGVYWARHVTGSARDCSYVVAAPQNAWTFVEFVSVDDPSGYASHQQVAGNEVMVTTNVPTPGAGPTLPGTWAPIERPEVSPGMHAYRTHTFKVGEHIKLYAGGCVRGRDGTWRQYVDPYASDARRDDARLYHGLVWIPGATPGPVRLASVVGKDLVVSSAAAGPPPEAERYLRLGYEADPDAAPDHPYPPAGSTGPAGCELPGWVRVVRGDGTDEVDTKNLDLTWTTLDDNWLPDTPYWLFQGQYGQVLPSDSIVRDHGTAAHDQHKRWALPTAGDPGHDNLIATTQHPSLDYNDRMVDVDLYKIGVRLTLCTDGPHVNWWPVSYRGTVYWMSHDARDLEDHGDDDYNMALLPVYGQRAVVSGLTLGNQKSADPKTPVPVFNGAPGVLLEFQANETVDEMRKSSSAAGKHWWDTFHTAVDQKKAHPDSARHMIDGHDAVVTGLFNLDCEHDCQTELHPAYALAIRENSSNPNEDAWAIYVETSGNEGGCSMDSPIPLASKTGYRHRLDLVGNRFVLRLPLKWSGGTAFDKSEFGLRETIGSGSDRAPHVDIVPSNGEVVVTFHFDASTPDTKPLYFGELRLRHTGP